MFPLSEMNNKLTRSLALVAVVIVGVASVIGSGGGGGGGSTFIPGIVVTDLSRYAYVVNSTDGNVSAYVVDTASGRLTYIGTAATGTPCRPRLPRRRTLPAARAGQRNHRAFEPRAGGGKLGRASGDRYVAFALPAVR